MTYVSWAALYEGASDAAYFGVLLPRIMDELILARGVGNATVPTTPAILLNRGDVASVANEACEARDAFHLVFIHADTGGRSLEQRLAQRSTAYCEAMHAICAWNPARCIAIAPRHETEAWVLCDPTAVMGALGFGGNIEDVGLPRNAAAAERLTDPKTVLNEVIRRIRGRRREASATNLYPAIAQRQNLAILRRSESFAALEASVAMALINLGCIDP
jgi:hypothetical protein